MELEICEDTVVGRFVGIQVRKAIHVVDFARRRRVFYPDCFACGGDLCTSMTVAAKGCVEFAGLVPPYMIATTGGEIKQYSELIRKVLVDHEQACERRALSGEGYCGKLRGRRYCGQALYSRPIGARPPMIRSHVQGQTFQGVVRGADEDQIDCLSARLMFTQDE